MISVVIPHYKQVEYLPDALDSLRNQTNKEFETILVLDGFDAQATQIGLNYGVKVIEQRNKGLASARNAGIMSAKGDYVLPLDADDMLLNNAIERLTQVIADTNADAIAPSFHTFGTSHQQVILYSHVTIDMQKKGNHLPYFMAIKRDVLLECGGYSPRMDFLGGYEDYHFNHDLLARGKKIVTVPDILVMYRTKANSMYTEAVKNHEQLMAQIHKDFPEVYAA